jgi:uncharacterized membrane-anchored protein
MTRRISVILLVLVCAVQVAVPVATIARREIALRQGETFRFRCAPVDPVDFFRGRYVELAFDEQQHKGPDENGLVRGQTVYARLETGEDGFARIVGLVSSPPESGPFVRCRVRWAGRDGVVTLELPFRRYYMEETKAPNAEELYRERVAEGPGEAWVETRILDGYAVLVELFIDGKPVHEVLEDEGGR